jgi:hypothetical protein
VFPLLDDSSVTTLPQQKLGVVYKPQDSGEGSATIIIIIINNTGEH